MKQPWTTGPARITVQRMLKIAVALGFLFACGGDDGNGTIYPCDVGDDEHCRAVYIVSHAECERQIKCDAQSNEQSLDQCVLDKMDSLCGLFDCAGGPYAHLDEVQSCVDVFEATACSETAQSCSLP